LILLSSVIVSPFFFHLIRGLGFPVAAQFNANPLPSFMVLFFGCTVMIGGTPEDKKELMLLTTYDGKSQIWQRQRNVNCERESRLER